MNVTINLMTEFEDIPNEVSHLLKFVQDELVFTSKRAANVSDKLATEQTNPLEALQLLHSIRVQMAKIDSRMDDCMSILNGYQHYLDNPPETLSEESEEPATTDASDEEVEEENEEG
tara:strand:+ start:1813 stop:2163 length:351 start_codon:yes stop_codon:yes gene_type:complete